MSDPIAYFITFRTYGTWLHGDERGSRIAITTRTTRLYLIHMRIGCDPHVCGSFNYP